VGLAEDSPRWLHDVTADSADFREAMRKLAEYCFVEVREESWSMHNCVHDWTLATLNKDIDIQHYWYAFDCIAASIKEDDWDLMAYKMKL
jgi:hypothetical protein